MAQIIRNQLIVEDDWTAIDDAEAIPESGKVVISQTRWLAEKEALKSRGKLGLRIEPSLDVAQLANELHYLSLIVIPLSFIKPKPEGGLTYDGRGYSQARLLRERYGFKGDIRANGGVFRDAMYYMHRCGFNEFEVREGQDLNEALGAFKDFTAPAYQAAADGQQPIFRRRRA